MAKGIRLHVWGDYALFTRPEMKAERVSYDVMTPSAARAVVSAIYWKPQIVWVVDRIHVLKPIQFTSIRRNEVAHKAVTPSAAVMNGAETEPLGIIVEDDRQQRASLVLREVAYVIEAHFMLRPGTEGDPVGEASAVDFEAKHISMFNRRASSGQCFHQPYLGCREFPAHFKLIASNAEMPPCELPESQMNKDFGFVFHDFIYRKDNKGRVIASHTGEAMTADARFFRAIAQNGIVTVPALDGTEVYA